MKRVLITGATGFLGRACAREMRSHGWEVRCTGRSVKVGEELVGEGFTFIPCDLSKDSEKLPSLVDGCAAVIHCAALSSPWGRRSAFVSANITATRNLLEACQRAGTDRLVHISTPSVTFTFGPQTEATEAAPCDAPAANHYIATKREAEKLVLGSSVPSLVLRPKAMIGPGDTTILPRVMKVAARGTFPLIGAEDLPLTLTWIEDAARAVRLAAEAPPTCEGKVYNITGGPPLARSVALRTLFAAAGLPMRYRVVPLGKAMAVASCMEMLSRFLTLGLWEPPLTRYSVGELGLGHTLDISAAQKELLYQPEKDLQEALSECGRAWRKARSS